MYHVVAAYVCVIHKRTAGECGTDGELKVEPRLESHRDLFNLENTYEQMCIAGAS